MRKIFREQAAVFVFIAVFYFILTLPQITLIFQDGRSTIRISGFFPIVAGLLYGPLGAAACGVGNLMSDAMGDLHITDLVGSFGVFMMGFLPYRLWHRLFLPCKNKPVFLNTVGSILKYVFITVIAAAGASAIGAIGGQWTQQYSFYGFFPQVALQYFNLSIVVGMLLFQLLSQYTALRPCIPKDAYRTQSTQRCFLLDYILCALIVVLSFVLMHTTKVVGAQGSAFVSVLCGVLVLCILILAFLPSSRRGKPVEKREDYQPTGSLQRQLVTIFLMLLCAFLAFYTASIVVFFHIHYTSGSSVEQWSNVLIDIAMACVVLLAVLSLLLRWTEKYLAKPMQAISLYAQYFVGSESLSTQNLTLPKSNNELDGLNISLNKMVDNIRQYVAQLKDKTANEERLAVEMDAARSIQMGLLTKDWKQAKPFDLAAKTQPAQEVGGDFYDFFRFSDKRLFVVIADVSGKGISAALFMMRANTILSGRSYPTIAKAIGELNAKLSAQNETMMFVTLFAGVVDLEAMEFRYVNAGHNPAIIYQNGSISVLDTPPNLAVGPVEDTQYKEYCVPISHDFRLLLYTDGVTDAENTAGEFFGMERFLLVAEENLKINVKSEQVIKNIEAEVVSFAGEANQADDITMLCLSIGEGELDDTKEK